MMAQDLRNALREFALQKMRELDSERGSSSTKSEESAKKSPKIKINRDVPKFTAETGKKVAYEPEAQPQSDKSDLGEKGKEIKTHQLHTKSEKTLTKRCADETEDLSEKKPKLFDEVKVEPKEKGKMLHISKQEIPQKSVATSAETGQEGKGLFSVKQKGLPSDKTAPTEKKIQIKIPIKLPQLIAEPEKPPTIETKSNSGSSSEDNSDESEDETLAVDGLPWRTILEDGELTPSSDSEEDEEEEEEMQDEKENEKMKDEPSEAIGDDKAPEKATGGIAEKDEEKTSEEKKSKHKHKSSKHKKHKHKKSKKKKKKSKHKSDEDKAKDSKKKESKKESKSKSHSSKENKESEERDKKELEHNREPDDKKVSTRVSKDDKPLKHEKEKLDKRDGRSRSSSRRNSGESRQLDESVDHEKGKGTSKEENDSKPKGHVKTHHHKEHKSPEESKHGRSRSKDKTLIEHKSPDESRQGRSRTKEKIQEKEVKIEPSEPSATCENLKKDSSSKDDKDRHKHVKTLSVEKETVKDLPPNDDQSDLQRKDSINLSSERKHLGKESTTENKSSESKSHRSSSAREDERKSVELGKSEKTDSRQKKDERRMKKEKKRDSQKSVDDHSKKLSKVKIEHLEEDPPSFEASAEDMANDMKTYLVDTDLEFPLRKETIPDSPVSQTETSSTSKTGSIELTKEKPADSKENVLLGSVAGTEESPQLKKKESSKPDKKVAGFIPVKESGSSNTNEKVSDAKPAEIRKKSNQTSKDLFKIEISKESEAIIKNQSTGKNVTEAESNKENAKKITEMDQTNENSKKEVTNVVKESTTSTDSSKAKLATSEKKEKTEQIVADEKKDVPQKTISDKDEEKKKEKRGEKRDRKEQQTHSDKKSKKESASSKSKSSRKDEKKDKKDAAAVDETKVESQKEEDLADKDKKQVKPEVEEKEEGAIDSDIEEGEITKKHKSKKKDKDKKKDRSRDRSGDRDKDRRHKRHRSGSRSESRSRSHSHKKHKRSRSKSPSDSDINIEKRPLVEKSYFSESKGCWVTTMVLQEESDISCSSGENNEQSNELYDIGDTYIRHPPRDPRSVFDRLGGGRSGGDRHGRDPRGRDEPSDDRYGRRDRYERPGPYGYRRRRRSYSRSRSRSRSPRLKIDKKKLLEIAKANALMKMRAGELPPNMHISESFKKAATTYEVNETIQKLTDQCKAYANTLGGSSDDESPVHRPMASDEEEDGELSKTFVRHPFRVKESAPIVMNIRDAIQIPVQSKDKLRTQFPVSSGSQHRKKEDDIPAPNPNDPYGQWKAVEKPTPEAKPTPPATPAPPPGPPPKETTGEAAQAATATTTATTPATTASVATTSTAATAPTTTAGPYVPGLSNIQPPKPVAEEDKVFKDAPGFSYDIGQIVSARLKAARQLQSNPHNVEALTVLHHSQKQIQTWAHSSKKPGQFTGTTDATFLRPEQLGHPNPKFQAWIKKDMFLTAAPVNTDIGRTLMEKMGWQQGEGLGKNKEGNINPLLLEIKTDRQGLLAAEEKPKKKGDVSKVIRKDLSGKHPVMALNELCNKRRWGKPTFEVIREDGPPHKKNFVFKVRIKNDEYVPTVTSGNKKDAKAMAATVALQKMGLIPT